MTIIIDSWGDYLLTDKEIFGADLGLIPDCHPFWEINDKEKFFLAVIKHGIVYTTYDNMVWNLFADVLKNHSK